MNIDMTAEISSGHPVYAYNATKLSPREVARTFVPPGAFANLRDARNAILVGPRGSGKTTLLKMLTSEALETWEGQAAALARERVQDVGVFVGVDAMWSEQISQVDPALVDSFGSAAYGLHIGRSFVRALIHRLRAPESLAHETRHLRATLERSDESSLVRRAAQLFKLPAVNASLAGLDRSLGDRVNELGTFRYRLRDGQGLPDWAYLNPLNAVAELAEMANDLLGDADRRWALLFDELELASPSILQDILRRLRGNEPLLVFKLSLSPVLKSTELLEGERGATHGQDVEFIPLTTPDRSEEFAAELFEKQRPRGGNYAKATVREILGESVFDSGGGVSRRAAGSYAVGTPVWSAMNWLSNHDKSFRTYLSESNVDLNRLSELPSEVRSSRIRKVRNLAVVRAHFRQGRRIDSEQTRAMYAGESSMLALADGNPRMTTILVRELVNQMASAEKLPLNGVPQGAAVEATTTRFLALLHAQRGIRFGQRAITMVQLLDALGRALHARVVTAPFSADAPSGFFVDQNFPDALLPLLAQAVNTGAIIHIPKTNSYGPVSQTVRGRHYRLSYLLAPRYGLPLRQGKTVAIWNLLEGDTLLGVRGRRGIEPMFELGGDDV